MSPGGLATAFGDFTIVDELSPEDPFAWSLESNVSPGLSSHSSGGNTSSEGLSLIISGANDLLNNVYPQSAASDDDLNDIFNQTISLNFEGLSSNVDQDPSPSQTDLGSYLSPQHSESTSPFFVPHSPVLSVPSALTSADLLPTTSNVDEDTLHRRYHQPCGVPGSSLMPPDGHEDNRQLCRHNRSHSSSCSLLTPDVILAENHSHLLQRRHTHSSGGQRSLETHEMPRRAKSVHNRSPYARPQALGDVYSTPISDNHRHLGDTRTPEQSAPPSPLPPSPANSRNSQQNTEDMFRRYDNASGIGYPILQRETIASEAVLQASAKRRKKPAHYQCRTCGQMLTSRDNLNSTLLCFVCFFQTLKSTHSDHMDAHTGVRRHQCHFCHERFRTRSVLKRHQKSIKCPASRNSTIDKEVCHSMFLSQI